MLKDVSKERNTPNGDINVSSPRVVDTANGNGGVDASGQVVAPVSSVPNVFTSGGVRGAFEPVSEKSKGVDWDKEGRQPVGWTPQGRPVYEQQGYDANKRPPLKRATEQMSAPLTSGQLYSPSDLGKVGVSGQLSDRVEASLHPRVSDFQKDPKKKDGGFLSWFGSLFKGRPGKREGETDDEYDERITRNNMRIATLGNALRHLGNLYYTSKGGVPQQFNDPNMGFREDLARRKAERTQKAAAERAVQKEAAEQAYKNAQLQLQRDKAEADKKYKDMSLIIQGRNANREDNKFEWEKDKENWNRNRLTINDAWKHNMEERKQKSTENYQRGRLAVEGRKATAAMLRATGGGSGGSGGALGNTTNLASPKGHLNRKKELSVYEENQIFNFLKKNGNVTAEYMSGWGGMTPEEKRAKMQFAISYAASDPSEKGRKAREYLKKHHGYSETATSAVGGLDFN